MVKVPILLVVFNRPEKTRKVLEEIARYQPQRLYISADGPRKNNEGDSKNCEEVRNIINEHITWPCLIEKSYSEINKGCKISVSDAVNWFFKNERLGVILEDDCLPGPNFFEVMFDLLTKYEDNEAIISVSGSNFGFTPGHDQSYFHSRYLNMWGWGSWRRSALNIDYEMNEWNRLSNLRKYVFLIRHIVVKHKDLDWGWVRYWKQIFDDVAANRIDTWDYQWFYYQFKTGKYTIVPSVNLVQNIGFDDEATHTNYDAVTLSEEARVMNFPLVSPALLAIDRRFEEEYLKGRWAYYKRQSLFWHIKHSIHQFFRQ